MIDILRRYVEIQREKEKLSEAEAIVEYLLYHPPSRRGAQTEQEILEDLG